MEDGIEMQMMSMSMKSGGSELISNFSGSWCLVGSTVGLGVGVGGMRWRRGCLIFGGLLIVIG